MLARSGVAKPSCTSIGIHFLTVTLLTAAIVVQQSRTLFTATPLEEKQKCAIQTNNRGWSGMHTETLDPKTQRVGDFKE
jgi:hypothetical protein